MLTVEQCEVIVREGEMIGEGADRDVFVHDDFPEWVVKAERLGSMSYREQNKMEYNNYLRLTSTLTPVNVPDWIGIPETQMVGRYIVQQRIVGEHPPEHDYDSAWRLICRCRQFGLPHCMRAVPENITLDVHELNVVWDGERLWVIDLGVTGA